MADQFVTEIRPRIAVSPRDARHDRLIRHFVPFPEVKRRLRDTLERNSKARGEMGPLFRISAQVSRSRSTETRRLIRR